MPRYQALILDWDKLPAPDRNAVMRGRASPQMDAATQRALEARQYQTYILDAPSLGHVYTLLNIEHPVDYPLRSMSPGDIAVVLATGRLYQCLWAGWREISHLAGDQRFWLDV